MKWARIAGWGSVVWIGACGGNGNTDLFSSAPQAAGRGGSTAGAGGSSAASGGSKAGATSSGGSAGSANASGAGETPGTAGASGSNGGTSSTPGGSNAAGGSAALGGASIAAVTGGRGGASAVGGATDGGSASAGEAGAGAAAGAGGAGGCEESCPPNGTCTVDGRCECHAGFIREGEACRRPVSCRELHESEPGLPSAAYTLRPALAAGDIQSYCEMSAADGGWTLVVNGSATFNPSAAGTSAALGYEAAGTNISYSTVLLVSDIMLDVRIAAISGEGFTARAVVKGVHAASRGRTTQDLFTHGPNYLEAEDKSNLTLTGSNGCNFSPTALEPLFCDDAVITLGVPDEQCNTNRVFAISGADEYGVLWDDCAGWPQATVVGGERYFPDNIRVWIR